MDVNAVAVTTNRDRISGAVGNDGQSDNGGDVFAALLLQQGPQFSKQKADALSAKTLISMSQTMGQNDVPDPAPQQAAPQVAAPAPRQTPKGKPSNNAAAKTNTDDTDPTISQQDSAPAPLQQGKADNTDNTDTATTAPTTEAPVASDPSNDENQAVVAVAATLIVPNVQVATPVAQAAAPQQQTGDELPVASANQQASPQLAALTAATAQAPTTAPISNAPQAPQAAQSDASPIKLALDALPELPEATSLPQFQLNAATAQAPTNKPKLTGQAAAQAADLATQAGQTEVSVQVNAPASQGVAPQSISNLAPAAVLADAAPVAAQQDPSPDGQGAGSQQSGQQADATSQTAPQTAPVATAPEDVQTVFALATAQTDNSEQSIKLAATSGVEAIGETSAAEGSKANTMPQAGFGAASGPQTASQAQKTAAPTAPRAPNMPTPAEQISVQIAKGVKEGASTINVQLNPDNLGRVEVKLELQDGQVKATVTADRPETLQLLKNDSSSLQQSLRDAGLNADAGSLSFNLRGDQQRQANQDQNQGQERRARGLDLSADADTPVAVTPAAARFISSARGVDINV